MELKRSLNLWLTLTYGLGTILGAGIYVLVGKVAGYAGFFAPLAFLLASVVAGFTAYSYSRLCARHPKAAGEAVYVHEAFHKRWLTSLTGWFVVLTGISSAAALTRGFAGYFQVLLPLPDMLIVLVLVILICSLASWGIGQSAIAAMIITLIELAGLILVIGAASFQINDFSTFSSYLQIPKEREWIGILMGVFLAFYAFIGFEDMVNLAEEVKKPDKTLPLAIYLSLGIATLFYILTAFSALSAIPMEELIESEAPFSLLFQKKGLSPVFITLISLVAIINGVLVQIIMVSRVLYGMGKQAAAPVFLAYVHPATRIPLIATLLASLAILILALWFPVVKLAEITSFAILLVFALVNLALAATSPGIPRKIVPTTGFILCLLLLASRFLI